MPPVYRFDTKLTIDSCIYISRGIYIDCRYDKTNDMELYWTCNTAPSQHNTTAHTLKGY